MTKLLISLVINGVLVGVLYGLMAFGLSIIKGLMNIPNFAHGVVFAIGAYCCAATIQWGGTFYIGIVVGTTIAGITGYIIFTFALSRLKGENYYLREILLLFGIAIALNELLLLIFGTAGISVDPPTYLSGSVSVGFNILLSKYLLFLGATSITVAALVWYQVERTKLGARIRASMEHPRMVAALGLDVRKIQTTGFVLGSILAGFAGALALPLLGATSSLSIDMLALAFVVLVIGGLGSLYGAFYAGIFVGIAQNVSAVWIPAASTAVIYLLMIAILLITPNGLFGDR